MGHRLKTLVPRVKPTQDRLSSASAQLDESRLRGRPWQRIRERILFRDRGLCQQCARDGRSKVASQVDHVVPRFEGGKDADSNLESLCYACHSVKSAEEERRRRGVASENKDEARKR